jgi:signal transduction histidine kinase
MAAPTGRRSGVRSSPRLPVIRSLRVRLTLLFFAITLAAVAVVYFYVAPSLESSLRTQKIHNLASAAAGVVPLLDRTLGSNVDKAGVDQIVRSAADRANARVTLLGISSGTLGVEVYPLSDSRLGASGSRFPLALEAARSGRGQSGHVSGPGGGLGVVAKPLYFGGHVVRVAVFQTPLTDVSDDVALTRRKILIAGAIGLLVAVLAGAMVARALSKRVQALERAARRVARGDFSTRFRSDSVDELGQLARALDDMQHQLAELDDARKRFIATASHELRTPIFSLGGFLELIQDEDLDEETRRQFVGQLREQVSRLGKLATALLDLSKLEAGSLELSPVPTDLGVLARAVTNEFIPALNLHRSHLELRIGRDPLDVVCDPERVAQIMRILIDNAITHTAYGTDIVVTARRSDGEVDLAVVDRGEGIHPWDSARIFEPFFTSDGVQGSGLGLAIARELAERMGAELGVESAPGLTEFTLRLRG